MKKLIFAVLLFLIIGCNTNRTGYFKVTEIDTEEDRISLVDCDSNGNQERNFRQNYIFLPYNGNESYQIGKVYYLSLKE